MTIQAQAIQEFKLEIASLHDARKRLLKERMSPGVKFGLESTKKSIERYEDIILWIPLSSDEAILSLLLEEFGLAAKDLELQVTQEK